MYRVRSTPILLPSVVNRIDTIDVIRYNELVTYQLRTPQMENQVLLRSKIIEANERKYLENSNAQILRKLKGLAENIYKLNVDKLKSLAKFNFYDPIIMKEIFQVMNAIVYLQPNQPSAVNPNERIKEWLRNLERIGSDSVEGFAFKGDLRNATSTFVIKSPKTSEKDLLHEFVVGLELNELRSYVPNFAYVFGGFKCTPPILKEEYAGLPNLPTGNYKNEIHPVSWCDISNKNSVQYIIYENIAPGVTFKEYVSKCTFSQFLDKYLQVLFALMILHIKKKGVHNDLHTDNVIIKTLQGNKISIPYLTELGTIEYLETDGISTIIDFGFTKLELKDGTPIGITGFEQLGIFYDRVSPFYDAYKLLMFSMFEMLTQKNMVCFQKCITLYRFFNVTEDPVQAIQQQSKYFFMTPYNQKTTHAGLGDFISYIRNNVPEYKFIMSTTSRTSRVLGCTGNDICISAADTIEILGFNDKKIISNVFDFYDIVSRLENEGRLKDIQEILSTVNSLTLLEDGITKYNLETAKIKQYFNTKERVAISIHGIDVNLLLRDPFRSDYLNFIIDTAEINESFQQIELIHDCIIFLNKYFPQDLTEIEQNYNLILDYYADILTILDIIKNDAIYLGPQLIKQLNLPELEILSKNIPNH